MRRSISRAVLVSVAVSLAAVSLSSQGPGRGRRGNLPDGPFRLASLCANCHANAPAAKAMRDEKGNGVGPHDLWRSSMMANAARDPLWRAVVSAEMAGTPSRAAAIQEKCMRCHAPMAVNPGEDQAPHIGMVAAKGGHGLARDGVSCVVCHMIDPTNLGSDKSFSGRFRINDRGEIYGPHRDPFARPMEMWTGHRATPADHPRDPALCGSCHTLHTDTLAADGTPTGSSMPEQTPYLEWRNSAYQNEVAPAGERAANCQDCHVPTTSVAGEVLTTRIARMPCGRDWNLVERAPFGRHVFVGGNALLPRIIQQDPDAAAATVAAVRHQLRNRTARVQIEAAGKQGDRLRFTVAVENRTGHKFPTGFPIRRAWLYVAVRDSKGSALFESGRWDAEGRIVDAAGRLLPEEMAGGPVYGHLDLVTATEQVQVYEGVMRDDDGEPTFLLMRAAGWLEDDRLLPAGWSADHRDAEFTAPVDTEGDDDFVAGGDRVHYDVALPAGSGPLTVEVELVYQTLGARWAAELFTVRTPEVEQFERAYRKVDLRPESVATAVTKVD